MVLVRQPFSVNLRLASRLDLRQRSFTDSAVFMNMSLFTPCSIFLLGGELTYETLFTMQYLFILTDFADLYYCIFSETWRLCVKWQKYWRLHGTWWGWQFNEDPGTHSGDHHKESSTRWQRRKATKHVHTNTATTTGGEQTSLIGT